MIVKLKVDTQDAYSIEQAIYMMCSLIEDQEVVETPSTAKHMATPKTEVEPEAEAAPQAEAEPVDKADTDITEKMLRAAAIKVVQGPNCDELAPLALSYGHKTISKIPKDKWPEVLAKLEEMA